MLHPITFSIPAEKIVSSIPPKTKLLSSLIPGDRSTYIYNTEAAYYDEYKQSLFAKTIKKAGWDCMRHYEILACGAIPYFPDLDGCPPQTMVAFPKELVARGNSLYAQAKNYTITTLPESIRKKCYDLIEELLAYTRTYLTTEAVAVEILRASGNSAASRILYLSGDIGADYLRCLCLHGFKKLYGDQCHDVPRIPHIYTDSQVPEEAMWGRGYTISKNIDPEMHCGDYNTTLAHDLIQRQYDLVIYGSYHRGMPMYDVVSSLYPPERIVLLCGEDIHTCNGAATLVTKGHHVFVREQ